MKNMFFILTLSICIVSCSHKKTSQIEKPVELSPIENAKQITFLGSNRQPSFSPHGDQLIYVSENRSSHANSQIYSYNLKTNVERRITFQSGEVNHPIFLNDSSIIYASSTDESKEQFEITKKSKQDVYLPMELYQSDLFGTDIIRLTENSGYDSEASVSSSQKNIVVYISKKLDRFSINTIDTNSLQSSTSMSSPGLIFSHPLILNNQLTLWIETNPVTKKNRIMKQAKKSKKVEVAKEDFAEISSMKMWPNRSVIVYSIKKNSSEPFYIEAYDLEKNCTVTLTKSNDNLIDPAIDDGSPSQLAFVRQSQLGNQLYLMPLADWACPSQ